MHRVSSKSFKIVTWVRWTFWAERRAGIDRGERDLHSEVCFFGIRLGWGEAIFRRYWRTKGHLVPAAWPSGSGALVTLLPIEWPSGTWVRAPHKLGCGDKCWERGSWGQSRQEAEESKGEPYTQPLLGRNPFTVTPESRPPGRPYVI